MKSHFPLILLLAVLLSTPSALWTQVTQPEGIYTNFIRFNYEDPDYPVKVAMSTGSEYGSGLAVYTPNGITDHVKGKLPYARVWAIVSDSALYLNMARYYMGNFYIKFSKLDEFAYFKGKRIVSKDEKIKRFGTQYNYGLIGLGISDAIRKKKKEMKTTSFCPWRMAWYICLTRRICLEFARMKS